jgi:hypothetical protein
MQRLTIINGHDEVIASQTVGDTITSDQIGAKIKHLLPDLWPFATYRLSKLDQKDNKGCKYEQTSQVSR